MFYYFLFVVSVACGLVAVVCSQAYSTWNFLKLQNHSAASSGLHPSRCLRDLCMFLCTDIFSVYKETVFSFCSGSLQFILATYNIINFAIR